MYLSFDISAVDSRTEDVFIGGCCQTVDHSSFTFAFSDCTLLQQASRLLGHGPWTSSTRLLPFGCDFCGSLSFAEHRRSPQNTLGLKCYLNLCVSSVTRVKSVMCGARLCQFTQTSERRSSARPRGDDPLRGLSVRLLIPADSSIPRRVQPFSDVFQH